MDARHRPSDGIIRVGVDAGADRRSVVHTVDDRWLLAYAVAVGEEGPEHVDLARPDGVTAHPVFPVAIEWPLLAGGPPGIEATQATLHRGVHLAHEIELHAPVRSGRLRTDAVLRTAEQRTSGTVVGVELRSYDAAGRLLVTSRHDTFFREVLLEGGGAPSSRGRPTTDDRPDLRPVASTYVDFTNAIVYTECARIWNPIHTDVRVARDAGLPDTILHGTEVLSRAVSAVTASSLVPTEASVASVGVRFSGMVQPGTILTTLAARTSERAVAFEVWTSDGVLVLSGGTLVFRERHDQRDLAVRSPDGDR